MIPVISFIGRHNSGKTTVLTKIVNHLSLSGYRVAVIKHVHHSLNIESLKDSERLYQSGASFVLASSPSLTIQYQRREQEPSFKEIRDQIPDNMDLLLVEGFKAESMAKIEVLRRDVDPDPMLLPETLALISDFDLASSLPVFHSSQIEDIANFILQILDIKK